MVTEGEQPTRFVRACRGESVDRVPVWLMRQAGRYMSEYQAVRAEAGGFLELCKAPELAAKATLDAARFLETDAAIIFSDITLPAAAMGQELSFEPGPKLNPPVRTMEEVRRLRPIDPASDLDFVMEAIRLTRAQLASDVSLIGFVGAPLTLAAYMVEGAHGKNWVEAKRLLYGEPKTMHALLATVAEAVTAHALAQVAAGCDSIQIFDSWAGELAALELHGFAFRYARQVVDGLRGAGVPIIYFARNIGAHLEQAAEIEPDLLGVDWTVSIAEARRRTGDRIGLQGNLDPTTLFTSPEEIDRRVERILREAEGLDGFVFNLGHGVLPGTPPENVRQVIKSVRKYGGRNDNDESRS